MRQSGYLTFFNVNKCGLYRIAKTEPQGLELSETFTKLKSWCESRPFEKTNPWDPKVNKNKTPCYCHKIHHDPKTGDFLLVLWKGETDKSGPLYGISINDDGSTAKVIKQTQSKFKKPVIWGRPCYYWVIPELNCVTSLKFENSRCDSAMFQEWVEGCVNFRIPLPDLKKVTTETGLVRIEITDDSDHPYRYLYHFNLGLRTVSTASAKLSELAKKVTHIIRRETVSISSTNSRQGFSKIFDKFSVPYASNSSKNRRVELKVEARPTAAEIKDIIDKHALQSNTGGWEDTGFIVENGTKTIWARSYRLTDNISVEDQGEDVLDAKALYEKISENRARYLKPIRDDDKLAASQA